MAEPLYAEAAELRAIALRLAAALAAAHREGRLHLALSPQCISLPQGTIADFGGAHALAYAAPEQVMHSAPVGPWTDVYSLGLVLLALASHRTPPMGTTIVGAIEARRRVPDLSAVPEALRPAMARMLEPDPAKRPQSMTEVIAMLEGRGVSARSGSAPTPRRFAWRAVAAGGLAVLGILAAMIWSSASRPHAPGIRAFRPALPAEERVRRGVEASLKAIACSWLDIGYPTVTAGRVHVEASGAAAATQAEIARLLQAAAGPRASIGASSIIPVDPVSCGMLDAVRSFREPSSEHGRALDAKQAQFHLQDGLQSCKATGRQAQIVVDARLGTDDFAILMMDSKGGLRPLYADRTAFDAARVKDANAIGDLGNGVYRLTFCTGEAGPAGVLLVRGRGPFDTGDTASSFADRAWAKGWSTQMTWYRVLN